MEEKVINYLKLNQSRFVVGKLMKNNGIHFGNNNE